MYYAAQDIIEYLMASTAGGAQDSEHRTLRAAAHNAYRDVINIRDWNWHVAESTLTTDALVGSGDGVETFTLPENVKNVDSIIPPQTVAIPAVYLTPTEWLRIEVKLPTLNAPIYWTVIKDPAAYDRWLLKIAGNTQSATYKYTYRRRPKMLQYMGYEPQCRQPGFEVEGAVRRYGTSDNFPESAFGVHPYTAQEIIGDPDSMQGTPPASAKTVVSDYLDLSDNMYTAVLSGAEAWLSRLLGKNTDAAQAIYLKDVRLAFEADSAAPVSGTRRGWSTVGAARSLGYYSPSGPDTGV